MPLLHGFDMHLQIDMLVATHTAVHIASVVLIPDAW